MTIDGWTCISIRKGGRCSQVDSGGLTSNVCLLPARDVRVGRINTTGRGSEAERDICLSSAEGSPSVSHHV